MKNKGLTIIEVIVLIGMIGVIAFFSFPKISDYIAKCRLDADMETAKELAVVMQEVLAENNVSENAVEHATPQLVSNMDGSDFKNVVYSRMEADVIEGKTKKDADGEILVVPEFYYTLNVKKARIEIYYGGITEEYQIYPRTGRKLVK